MKKTKSAKPMHKSKTVGAAAATVCAYLAALWLKAPPEVCQSIGVIGAGLVAVFLRSGVEDLK